MMRLMSCWPRAARPAYTSVTAPTTPTSHKTSGTRSNKGCSAGDEIHAGGHHRGRVDQGGDRAGSGHRVGQPHRERQLRRLAGGTDKGQQRHPGQQAGGCARAVSGREQRVEVQRVIVGEQQEYRQGQCRVADAGHHECLAPAPCLVGIPVPMGDEGVGAQAHQLPAQVQEQQVVRHHEEEHSGDEQVEVHVVAPLPIVVRHEMHGEQVDQETYPAGDADHDQAHLVHPEADRGPPVAHRHPGVEGLMEGVCGPSGQPEGAHRQRAHQHRPDGEAGSGSGPQVTSEYGQHRGSGQRAAGDQPQPVAHIGASSGTGVSSRRLRISSSWVTFSRRNAR